MPEMESDILITRPDKSVPVIWQIFIGENKWRGEERWIGSASTANGQHEYRFYAGNVIGILAAQFPDILTFLDAANAERKVKQ